MNNNQLHVALAFDERFWAPAFATIRSVCLTTRRRKDLVFHLCYPGLSGEAITTLNKIETEFGAKIVHHDVAHDQTYRHFAATLPHTRYISAAAYARMIFDKILDPEITRLIYLDCDLLIRSPIENLLQSDLGGAPIGAVKDAHALRFSNGRDCIGDTDLLDPADPYFNSGVMVIDLDAWRKMDMAKSLFTLQEKGILERLPNDQQILNYLFANNWQELDQRWNMFGVNRAIEALDPHIVHYTGPNKPWNLISGLPFARVYRHVMTNELFYRYMRLRWKWKFTGGPKRH